MSTPTAARDLAADAPAPLAVPDGVLERLRAAVEAEASVLTGLSHALHADPETKWQEHRAVRRIGQTLEAGGFTVRTGTAGLPTAFTAAAGRLGAHTHVGLVAEYDALPGLGHACGHNIIAAAAVGAGLALRDLLDELDLRITVVGTPGEEGGGGKLPLLEAGVFADMDAAMMIHPGPEDRAWAAPFAVAHFDVTYHGRASHAAAYPTLGINAADAFVVAQTAIGLLRQQLPGDTRVHGIVTEAGTAPNAIPGLAKGSWYARARSLDELEELYGAVRRCFEAGALATGCALEISETSGRYADLVNDEELLATFCQVAGGTGRALDPRDRTRTGMNTASTDMGNVSHVVRAIHPYLGIDSAPAVNHQAEFADAAVTPAADRAILDGALGLAGTAAALAASRHPWTA